MCVLPVGRNAAVSMGSPCPELPRDPTPLCASCRCCSHGALIQVRLRHSCLSQAKHSGRSFRNLEQAARLGQRGKIETKFFQLSFLDLQKLHQGHMEAESNGKALRTCREAAAHPPVQPQSLWEVTIKK